MTRGDHDAVDYLLGELSPGDRARVERRLAESDAFRAELERMRPVVRGLEALPNEAWQRVEPPPLRLPDDPAPASEHRSMWDRLRDLVPTGRMPAAALAATAIVALAVGFGIGALTLGGGESAPDAVQTVALAPVMADPSASGEAAVVADSAGGGEVKLDVSGLAPSDTGTVYELWLLNSPDDLLSLGTFTVPASGSASVRVPLPVMPDEFAFFDISEEPVGGDGRHSGHSVLRGETA